MKTQFTLIIVALDGKQFHHGPFDTSTACNREIRQHRAEADGGDIEEFIVIKTTKTPVNSPITTIERIQSD